MVDPEPARVWRVRLRRGDLREQEGTLRLEQEALDFEDRGSAVHTRLELSAIRSARRVRGSPILLVAHDDGDDRIETAFYFSQPPPLEVPLPGSPGQSSSGRPLGPLAAARSTKRRHQRENVKYLTTMAGNAKPTIDAWVEAIGARTQR